MACGGLGASGHYATSRAIMALQNRIDSVTVPSLSMVEGSALDRARGSDCATVISADVSRMCKLF